MTNEELAAAIQAGGADDLKPALYDRVKHLMYKICSRYYTQYKEHFTACGAELADLRQECYPAFVKALEAYKPDSGYAFTSYLNYPVKNAANAILGIRNKDGINTKPLDNCTSLDKIIETTDGEISLYEVIPNKTAEQDFERAIDQIADEQTRRIIYRALEKLEAPLRDVIVKYYFEDKTLQCIAESRGVSIENIRHRKWQALNKLRRDASLRILYEEQQIDRYFHFTARNYSRAYFEGQKLINAIERRGHYLSYGKRQAIIYDCLMQARAEDEKQAAEIEEKGEPLSDFEKYLLVVQTRRRELELRLNKKR